MCALMDDEARRPRDAVGSKACTYNGRNAETELALHRG